jgi:hypothetical protein
MRGDQVNLLCLRTVPEEPSQKSRYRAGTKHVPARHHKPCREDRCWPGTAPPPPPERPRNTPVRGRKETGAVPARLQRGGG